MTTNTVTVNVTVPVVVRLPEWADTYGIDVPDAVDKGSDAARSAALRLAQVDAEEHLAPIVREAATAAVAALGAGAAVAR